MSFSQQMFLSPHSDIAYAICVGCTPGRAQQLHAKLSQGIKRRGSLQDALRRLQAKQARAERQRIEYQTERARKIHLLLAKVEEVKVNTAMSNHLTASVA